MRNVSSNYLAEIFEIICCARKKARVPHSCDEHNRAVLRYGHRSALCLTFLPSEQLWTRFQNWLQHQLFFLLKTVGLLRHFDPWTKTQSGYLLNAWSEVKWIEIAQSCPTLCDPMDCSLPGSSIHGIFQARVLEWGAIAFSRGSSQPRNRTQVSRIAGRCFTIWATRELIYVKVFIYLAALGLSGGMQGL